MASKLGTKELAEISNSKNIGIIGFSNNLISLHIKGFCFKACFISVNVILLFCFSQHQGNDVVSTYSRLVQVFNGLDSSHNRVVSVAQEGREILLLWSFLRNAAFPILCERTTTNKSCWDP